MSKITDLYPLLKTFSEKNKSPYIQIDVFLEHLEKNAARKVQENPEWNKWLNTKGSTFWNDLSELVDEDKCLLKKDASGGQIYILSYYTSMLRKTYSDPDKMQYMPFPSEDALAITIPENQLKTFYLKTDLVELIESHEDMNIDSEADENSQIIKLILPEGCGSALLLHSMLPRKLLETTMLKIRYYLNTRGNKEFVLHKLTPQFHDKEKYLIEFLDHIVNRPMECVNSLEKSGDFLYLFWNHFCNFVKNDIKKRDGTLNKEMPEEMAIIQAVHIMEVCNNYYRAQSIKLREKETAFRTLEACMVKPPCYFTKVEIEKFSTDKSIPLLKYYSMQELDEYIKKVTTVCKSNVLPDWLIVNGKNSIPWYFKKEKYLSICVKLLVSTQPQIKKALSKRWSKLLREFKKEPAMEKDTEFEKLLASYTEEFNSTLVAMLSDKKLPWVSDEIERTKGPVPSTLRLVKAGKLLPLGTLYSLSRKEMLSDIKYLLPFWYSVPILTAIAAFFRRLANKKEVRHVHEFTEMDDQLNEVTESKAGKEKAIKELHRIAGNIQVELIPKGKTMEPYMEELENKWNRLIGENARKDLITDVQTLSRTNLRKMLRVRTSQKLTRETIHEAVKFLVDGTPALRKLSYQDALCQYMELYMVKLLLNIK